MKTKKTAKKNLNKNVICEKMNNCIIFNTEMRKIFVKGVLQDIKGYFENKTNGVIEVLYEDYDLKNHEFGFKLYIKKTNACSKQTWSEVSSSIVNVINYMFSMNTIDKNNIAFDVTITADSSCLEVELISNW